MKLLTLLAATACIATVGASPSGSLINPNANSDAKALMAFLMKNYGKTTLSGQQDNQWTNWVSTNIGKTPAVTGFDFMDYSPSRVAHGTKPNEVELAIEWAKKGGIVTFVWHWGSPRGEYDSAAEPWYSNFYTAATSFDVGAAMNNPSGSDYALILRDIDAIATQLKRLQAAGVPVIWRPLHEADGGWFWWGAKGSAPCKKLYALLYSRLTDYHKLNNLLWVWNSPKPDWYPGNDHIDLLTTDIYATAGNHDSQVGQFNALKALCGDTKIIGLAEAGVIPTWSASAPWSWWVVWGGSFINDGKSNSKAFLQQIYSSPNLLTLDKLGNWKSGSTNPPVPTKASTTIVRVTTASNPKTSTARATTTSKAASSGGVALYGQCGGQGYTGPTNCAQGTCKSMGQWYSQCTN